MATYAEQVEEAFKKLKSQGMTDQTAYEKAKTYLSTKNNPQAMTALDSYYTNISKPATQVTAEPKQTIDMGISSFNVTPTNTGVKSDDTTVKGPLTEDSAIQKHVDTFNKIIQSNPGKSQEELKKLIEDRIKSSGASDRTKYLYEQAMGKVFSGVKTDDKKEGMTTTMPKVDAASNLGDVDSDFSKKVQEAIDAMKKEYDEKIKNQQEFSNNIKTLYDKNKAEFDAKYANLRDTIAQMESTADQTREEILGFTKGQFEESMKRIALEQAGRHAAISGRLTGQQGVSSEIINNTLAEAANDPTTMAAVEALKDKQIKNLTDLQTNYNNWYNQILSQKTGVTDDEKALADQLLAKTNELDKELKDLKQTGIEAMYKPIQDYFAKSVEQSQGTQLKTEKTKQDIEKYTKASPEERKDILSDKLFNYSPSIDRALIGEDAMREAIAKGSLMDAVLFLSTKIVDKANQNKLNEIAAQLGQSSGGSSSGSSSGSSAGSSSGSSSGVTSSSTSQTSLESTSKQEISDKGTINKDNAFKDEWSRWDLDKRNSFLLKQKNNPNISADAIKWMEDNLQSGIKITTPNSIDTTKFTKTDEDIIQRLYDTIPNKVISQKLLELFKSYRQSNPKATSKEILKMVRAQYAADNSKSGGGTTSEQSGADARFKEELNKNYSGIDLKY